MNMAQYRLSEDRPEHALSLYQRALTFDPGARSIADALEAALLRQRAADRPAAEAVLKRIIDDWSNAGKIPIGLDIRPPLSRDGRASQEPPREAGEAGATAPAVYNAANEVCVRAFLDGEMRFTDIVPTIERCARDLADLGVKEDELKAIDKEIKDIVVEAAKYAEDAPEPDAAELYTDVLVGSY